MASLPGGVGETRQGGRGSSGGGLADDSLLQGHPRAVSQNSVQNVTAKGVDGQSSKISRSTLDWND